MLTKRKNPKNGRRVLKFKWALLLLKEQNMNVAFTYKLIHDTRSYIAFFKVSLQNWFYLNIIIHSLMNSGYGIYYLQK